MYSPAEQTVNSHQKLDTGKRGVGGVMLQPWGGDRVCGVCDLGLVHIFDVQLLRQIGHGT